MQEQLNNQQQHINSLMEEHAVMWNHRQREERTRQRECTSSRVWATACDEAKALRCEKPGVVRCCTFVDVCKYSTPSCGGFCQWMHKSGCTNKHVLMSNIYFILRQCQHWYGDVNDVISYEMMFSICLLRHMRPSLRLKQRLGSFQEDNLIFSRGSTE